MIKLLDRFTIKRHYFVVKENDLIETMKMLNTALFNGYFKGGMNVKKGDEKEWHIQVNLTKNQWEALLVECKNKKYQLVIKDDPDRMYFNKVKEVKES